jgi:hypothetical protein
MLKKEPLLKKNFMQNNRNRVPVKIMKAFVVHRSSVKVGRTLPR